MPPRGAGGVVPPGKHSARYGLTTMCVGLGMGGTVLWENLNAYGTRRAGTGR
jgi:hypothetical protein